MTCFSCRSVKRAELTGEMIMHFRGVKHLDNPGICLFPALSVCLDCGFVHFNISKAELLSVAEAIQGEGNGDPVLVA